MTLAWMTLVALLAGIGHGAFWVGLINRWHATGFPRKVVKLVTLLFYAGFAGIPLAMLAELSGAGWDEASTQLRQWNWITIYAAVAAALGAGHLPIWARRKFAAGRLPQCVRLRSQRVVDIAGTLGYAPMQGLRTALFHRVPYNQLWQLHIVDVEVCLPRLPEALRGLSICHWSDLHFSGRIDRDYFHEVVRQTNALRPDLIALTGDVCDAAHCIDWIVETLGPAEAPLGKYFILGNHDLRTKDVARLRAALAEAGFVDVGGQHRLIADGQIEIAGNELPWLGEAPAPPDATLPAERDPLQLLLAHTPDQYAWARAQGYDLMLAGHTHGGQVRLPVVGPIICPSWHGTKYAYGFFHDAPTVMHVSRGTASLFPLRINCPPEITRLMLTAAAR